MLTSKYTSKEVDWRHVIIELLCENKARLDKQLPLPQYFWRQKKWKNYWGYQSKLLKPILEHVDYFSVHQAIKNTKATSLKNKKFKQECWKIYNNKIIKQISQPNISGVISTGRFIKTKTNLDLL